MYDALGLAQAYKDWMESSDSCEKGPVAWCNVKLCNRVPVVTKGVQAPVATKGATEKQKYVNEVQWGSNSWEAEDYFVREGWMWFDPDQDDIRNLTGVGDDTWRRRREGLKFGPLYG